MSKDRSFKIPDYVIEQVGTFQSLSQIYGWNIIKTNIPETWEASQGDGIKVFVLDTGYSPHTDLATNLSAGPSFISEETVIDNSIFHAVHVSGIIAAENNTTGVVGVAPKATVVAVKVLSSETGSGSVAAVRKGLQYALDAGADIVNMSLGSPHRMDDESEKILQKLYDKGVPVICASGNDGGDQVNYPARYKNTIAIGAYDKSETIPPFSNSGENLDFVSPGVNILSTWGNNKYSVLTGTSMAAPWVTGVVALLLSKHRKVESETGENDCKTVPEILEHLIKFVRDFGPEGKDESWGHGIIDPFLVVTDEEDHGSEIVRPKDPKPDKPEKPEKPNKPEKPEKPNKGKKPNSGSSWSKIRKFFSC